MKVWNCFIYTVLFFIITLSLVLISSPTMTKPIIIIMGCMWLYGLIKFIVSGGGWEDNGEQRNEYNNFVSDYASYKVGEWLSKKH